MAGLVRRCRPRASGIRHYSARWIDDPVRVFLVAGEPSGDVIGGRLVAAMRRLWPASLSLAGIGGRCMEREGVTSVFEMSDIAVMGITELAPHLLTITTRLRQAVDAAVQLNPHVIVTIDSKGFAFRFLRRIKDSYSKRALPSPLCVHYVAPSFWAWKGGEEKLRSLSGLVDHFLCILPFEEPVCQSNGLNATFVGHPVLDDSFDLAGQDTNLGQGKWMIRGNGHKFRKDHSLASASPVIAVLPGSRSQELRKMLPIYGSALSYLSKSFPDVAAVIPTVSDATLAKMVDTAVQTWRVPVTLLPDASLEDKYNAFAASDAALTTSGTAVMQLQMSRVPCVVAYRASLITEWIIKYRTKLKYISLPNIVLDAPIIPEALFSSCKPDKLACLLRNILEDPVAARRGQARAAETVLEMIQPPEGIQRPSSAAARAIWSALVTSSGRLHSDLAIKAEE